MEQVEHTAADHPELDDPEYLKALVHALLHRIEVLEALEVGRRVHAAEEVTS